MLSYEM